MARPGYVPEWLPYQAAVLTAYAAAKPLIAFAMFLPPTESACSLCPHDLQRKMMPWRFALSTTPQEGQARLVFLAMTHSTVIPARVALLGKDTCNP